jgi:hypothetical protein
MGLEKTAAIPLGATFSVSSWLKGFLILVLLLLPFQKLPATFMKGAEGSLVLDLVRYVDEGSFLVSIVILLTFILIKPASYRIISFPFTNLVVLFFIVAMFSLLVNRVEPAQGFFGTYDVMKNILVIYVFSHAGFTREDLLRVIGMLQKIAIVIGLVAVIAEVAAMVWGVGIGYLVKEGKRLGLYRVFSLAGKGNWNYLGIYMTLIFYLSLDTGKPGFKRATIYLATLSTIFLTFSRQAWVGFGLMGCVLKRRFLPLGLVALIAVALMFLANIERLNTEEYFRAFIFVESLNILKDNVFFGVGPGMYGSLSASMFGTPYYSQWPSGIIEFAERIHGIDMFWPSLWSEFGMVGATAYLSVWVSIFMYLKKTERFFREKGDGVMGGLGSALRYFMLALGVMGFAGGLNAAFVVFTYFGLLGMYISAYHIERRAEATGR